MSRSEYEKDALEYDMKLVKNILNEIKNINIEVEEEMMEERMIRTIHYHTRRIPKWTWKNLRDYILYTISILHRSVADSTWTSRWRKALFTEDDFDEMKRDHWTTSRIWKIVLLAMNSHDDIIF